MIGAYDVECRDCERPCRMVVASTEDGDPVVTARARCDCPGRPTDEDALEIAREDFAEREQGIRWDALYRKHPEVV